MDHGGAASHLQLPALLHELAPGGPARGTQTAERHTDPHVFGVNFAAFKSSRAFVSLRW